MSNNFTAFFYADPDVVPDTQETGLALLKLLNKAMVVPFVAQTVAEARASDGDAGYTAEETASCDLYQITITKVGQTV